MVQFISLLVIVLPFIGIVAAGIMLWGTGFSWLHLFLFAGMYFITAVGITVGYHRMFTHRALQTSGPMRAFFAILGSMAVEGPLLKWVAVHRRHHQHADENDDPHSPHLHGDGLRGMLSGLWHAHIGWIFLGDAPGLDRYVGDLQKDKVLSWINDTFPLWALIGLLIPTALGGLITMSWTGALLGLIWGGFVRIFFVHHVTWSINSVCHLWGTRPFDNPDESRNNAIFGVLALGEGWHNNHHAFPTSARHGLRWWQFDMSYLIIRAMERMGLATKVRVPTAEAMAAKLRNRPDKSNSTEAPEPEEALSKFPNDELSGNVL